MGNARGSPECFLMCGVQPGDSAPAHGEARTPERRFTGTRALRPAHCAPIRQKRAKEGFSGRRKPAPKARTDLFGRQSVSGNGRSLRGLVKRQYRPREDKPYDRGYFLRRELTLLAEGKDGHRRQVHTAGRRGKPGRTETFYSADPVKARKKEARIRRKQKREIKKAGKKRGKLFRSELARTLAQDMRRANGIRQMQRMEQISMQEMERENTRAVLRTVTFPARFSLRLALRKAVPGIASALAAGIKSALPILVPVGGVLFLLLFLVLFIQGLFAGIAGEEAADGQTAAGSAAGAEVVEYAEQWIGVVRYVWGGGREHDTAWQTYADCSSFVHGVFAHFGYEIGEVPTNRKIPGHRWRAAWTALCRAISFYFTAAALRRGTPPMWGSMPGTAR